MCTIIQQKHTCTIERTLYLPIGIGWVPIGRVAICKVTLCMDLCLKVE